LILNDLRPLLRGRPVFGFSGRLNVVSRRLGRTRKSFGRVYLQRVRGRISAVSGWLCAKCLRFKWLGCKGRLSPG